MHVALLKSQSSHELSTLAPESDKHLISPYHINPASNMEVMRIEEMISN